MKRNTYLLLMLLFVFFTSNLSAQDEGSEFTLSGEIRPRTEFSHGYKTLVADENQNASLFTSQRTRLNFFYKNSNVAFKVVLQDVRNWGSQPQLVTVDSRPTYIHEAWAEVSFNSKFSLKAGRQELVYDDHRIFGSVGWAQQARSHDVAVFKYKGAVNFHVGFAYNQDGARNSNLYGGPDAYKAMQFVWFNKKTDNINASFLFLNNGKPMIDGADQVVKYSQTLGGRFAYKSGALSAALNAYYQMGSASLTTDISAFNLGVELGYKVNAAFSAKLGFEMLSGNKADDENMNAFTPFYGTNHKFNGHMDYFYVGNHGGSVGLNDIYVQLKYKINKAVYTGVHIHYFMSNTEITGQDAALGTEIDYFLGYKVAKGVAFKFGYSQMLATEAMQARKGGDFEQTNNWAYLMLVIKPTLFTSKK